MDLNLKFLLAKKNQSGNLIGVNFILSQMDFPIINYTNTYIHVSMGAVERY